MEMSPNTRGILLALSPIFKCESTVDLALFWGITSLQVRKTTMQLYHLRIYNHEMAGNPSSSFAILCSPFSYGIDKISRCSPVWAIFVSQQASGEKNQLYSTMEKYGKM